MRRMLTVAALTVAVLPVLTMTSSAANATGVYLCYSSQRTEIDYPGMLGGGHIYSAPTVEGAQTSRCSNGGAGVDLLR